LSAYIVTQFSALALDGVEENRRYCFFWMALVKVTLPSTGIWDFLIYRRPRLISLRKQNPESSLRELLRHIVLCSNQDDVAKPVRRRKLHENTNSVAESKPANSSVPRMNDMNRETDFTPELDICFPLNECHIPESSHGASTTKIQNSSDEHLEDSSSHDP
jgi:hypothetical protein